MLSAVIFSFLSIFVLAMPSHPLATSTVSTIQSNSIYYLSNCFLSTDTNTQHAEIDYYTSVPKSFPASIPKSIAVLNPTEGIDYEDNTVNTVPGSPFNITIVLGVDAYTAKAGTIVGSATGSSVKGTLKCTRLTRVVVYDTKDTKCYADYACA